MKRLLFSFLILTSSIQVFSQITEEDTTLINDVSPQDLKSNGIDLLEKNKSIDLEFRGFVRLSGMYDFNGLTSNNVFITYNIPTTGEPHYSRFYMDANQSRFGLNAKFDTKKGAAELYIEGHFFPDGNFNVRQAYGKYRNFVVGHTYTTFSNPSAMPYTLDFEGPNSMVYHRVGQIRYQQRFLETMSFGVALESPEQMVTADSLYLAAPQRFPDVVARLRIHESWGQLQVATVYRELAYKSTLTDVREFKTGFATNISLLLNLGEQDVLTIYAVAGEGSAYYMAAFATENSGFDLLPLSDGTGMEIIPTYGGFVALQHFWRDKWQSNAVISATFVDNGKNQVQTNYDYGGYASVNLIYTPFERISAGAEYLFGTRFNVDNTSGIAHRIQFVAQIAF